MTTASNVSCTLSLGYPGAPGPAGTTSSAMGIASWRWHVADTAPLGSWPVRVSCGSGSASAQFQITPQQD